MKVTIKLVSKVQFQVDAEPSDSIATVKTKIQEVHPEYDPRNMKLILQGRILKDDEKLEATGFTEASFMVLMVSKPAPAAAPAPAPAAVAPAPAPVPAPAPAPVAAPAPAPVAAPPAPVAAPAANPFAGPEFEASVQMIMEMGFAEGQIRVALQRAFGHADRAVELLMSGAIPEGAVPAPGGVAANDPAPAPVRAPAPAPVAAPGVPPVNAADGPLSILRAHPQFDQMRRIVQQHPDRLPDLLASFGASAPELLQLINANQGIFMAMMSEPLPEDEDEDEEGDEDEDDAMMGEDGAPNMAAMAALLAALGPEQQAAMAQELGIPPAQLAQIAAAAAAGMGGPGGPGGAGPGRVVVRLTADEMEAVNRLVALGFDQNRVIEAFILCDRNEELAANYLFDQMEERDD